jgi:hypothetical protein
MDATMILIKSDAELARARALVDQLWSSNDPTGIVRLEAQSAPDFRLLGIAASTAANLKDSKFTRWAARSSAPRSRTRSCRGHQWPADPSRPPAR